MIDLRERVAIVTGAGRGIGRAYALRFAAYGARVVVNDAGVTTEGGATDEDPARDVVHEITEAGGEALAHRGDVGDAAVGDAVLQRALDTWGRLDGALISVGGPPGTNPPNATDEQWRDAFESVMLGAIRVARTALAHLGDGGVIGFVLSTSVKQPVGGIEISSGLRPGLAMWAKHLADEVGPNGVRVFSLLPGRILTDRMTSLMPDPQDRDRLAQTIPLRRMGNPDEFGRVAAYLLSPAASYLTGLVVPIDGGALRAL